MSLLYAWVVPGEGPTPFRFGQQWSSWRKFPLLREVGIPVSEHGPECPRFPCRRERKRLAGEASLQQRGGQKQQMMAMENTTEGEESSRPNLDVEQVEQFLTEIEHGFDLDEIVHGTFGNSAAVEEEFASIVLPKPTVSDFEAFKDLADFSEDNRVRFAQWSQPPRTKARIKFWVSQPGGSGIGLGLATSKCWKTEQQFPSGIDGLSELDQECGNAMPGPPPPRGRESNVRRRDHADQEAILLGKGSIDSPRSAGVIARRNHDHFPQLV